MAARPKHRSSGSDATGVPFRIRTALLGDAGRLAELERACFADPWTRQGLAELLDAPHVLGRVVEGGEGVVAYALARYVAETAEILDFAVAPDQRGRGLARALLDDLILGLQAQGVTEVYLEVRASNQPARHLYEGRGFRVAGMRRAYYRRPTEDALVLRLALTKSA